ncbi:hypothetical protein L579_0430 [Pantoea sp. AS-PWVM4]|nr:hypothetical protein L579_0430 [Pantoea sp. AS-PWVM4]
MRDGLSFDSTKSSGTLLFYRLRDHKIITLYSLNLPTSVSIKETL